MQKLKKRQLGMTTLELNKPMVELREWANLINYTQENNTNTPLGAKRFDLTIN